MAPLMSVPRGASAALNRTIVGDFASWARDSPDKLDQLYESAHAAQCVLRALPPIARLYVARVLFLPADRPAFALAAFADALQRRARARDRHAAALATLRDLRVFLPVDHDPADSAGTGTADPAALAVLNPHLARQLRRAATGLVPPVFGGPLDDVGTPDLAELDTFSAGGLENILNFAIGNSDGDGDVTNGHSRVPSVDIQRALESTYILTPCDGGRSMRISSVGFQFLLKDAFSQVWVLLRDVITNSFRGSELHALDYVFQLSFAAAGRAYALDSLSEEQRRLAPILHELGVIRLDRDRAMFEPTPLGIGLVASASRTADDNGTAGSIAPRHGRGVSQAQLQASGESNGADVAAADIRIIVETNFRVYAYTTSAFQTNLLSLFTHMRYQLPNLVVGHLTREKVRDAFMNGITADQIIGFLNSHGHPRMKNGVIPTTVRDEIKLWEAEQERVQFSDGFLLSDFESASAFEDVLAFAKDISGCLWHNSSRRQLVVYKEDYERIRGYIKSLGSSRAKVGTCL